MNKIEQFLSLAMNKEIKIDKFISAEKSESTNSYYFIIKLSDSIICLALSDHDSLNHSKYINEISDEMEDDFDDVLEELEDVTDVDHELSCKIDDYDLFGIKYASQYKLCAENLIGKSSIDRAFLNKAYTIKNAKLSENNKVLTITYDDETKLYINYNPVNDNYNDSDLAIIEYLLDRNDLEIHQVRKMFYNNIITAYSEKEFRENFDEKDNDEELINLINDCQTIYSINNKNYIVDSTFEKII